MRRVAYTTCLLALAVGCQPSPKSTTAAVRSPSQASGKIPITTKSEEARALFVRGRTLNENLQPHEAFVLFQQAVAIDTTFAFGEYSLAATSPTSKERDGHLKTALTLSKNASPGERLLIDLLEARAHGDPQRARLFAESLVVQYPNDERAHGALASAYSAQQMYERAVVELRAAITLNPNYSLAYNQLGYAYRSAGQMAAAETVFTQYIALVPNDPNPYDSYAELLMKGGRFDESIVQYRKALAIDPHFSGSFVGIAANEMLAGRSGAAVAESERYFGLARDDGERRTALLTLAMIHVEHGATDASLRAMEQRYTLARAIGDTVNMSADGVLMADILLEAGRADAAGEQFIRAHTLLAASSRAANVKMDDALGTHYDLARVSLAKGDLRSARAEAIVYAAGANARHNDARMRQAHELNGLVALASKHFDESLIEFAQADQQNPAVLFATARAHAGRNELPEAQSFTERAKNMNILLTFPYVFTRATIAASTRSATSESVGGKPR